MCVVINKNNKNLVTLALFAMVALSIVLLPFKAFASEGTSEISYSFVNISTMPNEEKEQIIESKPSEINSHDYEYYKLVYQDKNNVINMVLTNGNSAAPSQKKEMSSGTFPKTGEYLVNDVYMFTGILILILVFGTYGWKRKKLKEMLLVFIVLGGASSVFASEQPYLRAEEKITMAKGTQNTKVPENIEGFEYVGYIHTYKDNQVASKGSVIISYQDEQGKKLIDDVTLSGNIGSSYSAEQKKFDNYTFKEVKGEVTGLYNEKTQNIIYVYSENKMPILQGLVKVFYQDDEGRKLAEDEVLSGNIGDAYTVENRLFDNYTFKEIQGERTGTFSENDKEVYLIYTSKDAVLNIEFVENGMNPASSLDLLNYGNGLFLADFPTIENYYFIRDYDNKRFMQNELISSIIIQTKIGNPIDVPDRIEMKMYTDKDEYIQSIRVRHPIGPSLLIGVSNYEAKKVTKTSSVIENKVTTIQYEMSYVPIVIPF